MGKKAAPPPQQVYRDDPDADAVSLHTTRGDYEYNDEPRPPTYTESEASASAGDEAAFPTPDGERNTDQAPLDIYGQVTPPRSMSWRNNIGSNENSVVETAIRMDRRLDDPQELEAYIKSYIRVVKPDPQIHIAGYHTETVRKANNKQEKQRVNDFNIAFSLQQYLGNTTDLYFWRAAPVDNSRKTYRGSWRKTKAPVLEAARDEEAGVSGDGDCKTLTLTDWCHDFCNSPSKLKVFRVSRHVAFLDTEYLRIQIEKEIRSTHYHGHIDVSFPIADRNVDIYTDHWVNRWRLSWVRWLFYLAFLWIFTWPILFFLTKRWDVYSVCWNWSVEVDDNPQTPVRRKCASISEEEWIQEHQALLKCLCLEKYKGNATGFSTDVSDGRIQRDVNNTLPTTGNRNVDAAASLIRGGLDVWNAVQGRGRQDPLAWGADC